LVKFGLKLWSINLNYIYEAKKLYDEGLYYYIELYSVPGSYEEYSHHWKKLKIPFFIHAPHFGSGLNFSFPELFENNKKLVLEAIKFADLLDARRIIFHPGVNGKIEETIKQINKLFDPRMVIENKPYRGNGENLFSLGSTPDEIKKIKSETGVSFCLDFGHAICSANALGIDYVKLIKEFLYLNPVMFHLSDGNFKGIFDSHLNFGKGTFPLKEIVTFIPENAFLTIETEKNYKDTLKDFVSDVNYLHSILRECF
jgi:endonuclease IV